MNKYRNKKVILDNGRRFDSQKEYKRYCELVLLERAKKIKDLKLQVPFILYEKSKYGRKIKYIADFTYYEDGVYVVEDVKGVRTPVYKLKKRIVAEKYGIVIKEI